MKTTPAGMIISRDDLSVVLTGYPCPFRTSLSTESRKEKAIQQLDRILQQKAASFEEMASTSEELASQSEQLKSMIAFFKVDSVENSSSRHVDTRLSSGDNLNSTVFDSAERLRLTS